MSRTAKIQEEHLLNVISEETERCLNEFLLKESLKKAIKEALETMPSEYAFEESDDSGNKESNTIKRKRDAIENLFKKDLAPPMSKEAYNLFNVDKPKNGKDTTDMKNARSLFAKKAENAKGDNGHTYEFSPEEVNKIYNDLSSSHLTEAQLAKIVSESVSKTFKEMVK